MTPDDAEGFVRHWVAQYTSARETHTRPTALERTNGSDIEAGHQMEAAIMALTHALAGPDDNPGQ